MKTEERTAYSFGPKKQIRVGTLIRTRISASSGPVYRGNIPQGERGVFRVQTILVTGRRVHVEAIDVQSGRTVTLYLSGPKYKSPAPSTVMKPYKFNITSDDVQKRRKKKREAKAAGAASESGSTGSGGAKKAARRRAAGNDGSEAG